MPKQHAALRSRPTPASSSTTASTFSDSGGIPPQSFGAIISFEQEGIKPDVLTLGKGLGAGIALSAVLANTRASCFEPGDQGGTFNGDPFSAAVALQVLAIVAEPAFLNEVVRVGAMLRAGLEDLARDFGGAVRSRGLLLAWVLALRPPFINPCFRR